MNDSKAASIGAKVDYHIKEAERLMNEAQALRGPDTRGVKTSAAKPAADGVYGMRNETLAADQSMTEWLRKAREHGAVRSDGTGRDLDRYWAERAGIKAPTAESRALGEDTTSGAGAAAAAVPQEWTASFIDLLRSKLVLHQAGMRTMPMDTEVVNMPQWLDDPAPVWLAENSAISIDNNPQLSTLQFNATGAYHAVNLMSIQAMQDATAGGGLSDMLRESIAQKFARVVESVAFYGTAGNAGNPGLLNESGLVIVDNGANGGAPVDTTPFSLAAESVRKANAEPSAFITNPQLKGTFARLNASTYAKYWDMPGDVAGIPVLDSTSIVSNETLGTGTNLSSLWCGPWDRVIMGVRMDLQVRVLNERYADYGQVGFWSFMRFSIRASHPEAFAKYTGYVTT